MRNIPDITVHTCTTKGSLLNSENRKNSKKLAGAGYKDLSVFQLLYYDFLIQNFFHWSVFKTQCISN